MAESGTRFDMENETSEIFKGHGTYFPSECGPCKYQSVQKEAKGYCEDCREFLCSRCIQDHRKFKSFRSHSIAVVDKMPMPASARSHRQPQVSLTPLLFCEEHRSNEVEFYCGSHRAGFCSLCRATKHEACDIMKFEDAVSSHDVTELPAATYTLQCFEKEFEKKREKYESFINKPMELIETCRSKIAETKKRILVMFNNLERKIDLIAKEESECKGLKEDIKLCSDVVNHLREQVPYIKEAMRSDDQKAKLMALIKTIQLNNECRILRNKLCSGSNKNMFEFIQSEKLDIVLKKLDEIGQVFKVPTELTRDEPETNVIKNSQTTSITSAQKQLFGIKVAEFSEHAGCQDAILISKMPLTPLSVGKFGPTLTEESNVANSTGHLSIIPHEPKKITFREALLKPVVVRKKEDCITIPAHDKSVACSDVPVNPLRDDLHFLNEYFQSFNDQVSKKKTSYSSFKHESSFFKTVRTGYDTSPCDITGIAFLESGHVVLCDHANSNVKLLDVDFKVISVCRTKGKPWDVAFRKGFNEIVLTLSERLLQFLTFSENELKVSKAINTKMMSWGIDIYKDHLFLTQHNNPGAGRLEIRHISGSIVKQIMFDTANMQLLRTPWYVHVHEAVSQTSIYMSDGYDKAVLCLDLTKGLVEKISSQGLQWPKGIVADESGNCLVCLRMGNNVKYVFKEAFERSCQVEKDTGKKFSNILDISDCQRPQSLDIRWSDLTVVIGSANVDTILVKKYTPKKQTLHVD